MPGNVFSPHSPRSQRETPRPRPWASRRRCRTRSRGTSPGEARRRNGSMPSTPACSTTRSASPRSPLGLVGGPPRGCSCVSAAWGPLSMNDSVPAYRLSMGASLPGFGPVAAYWRERLGPVLDVRADGHLVVDCRSATYAAAWRPGRAVAARTVAVRVLRDVSGAAQCRLAHGQAHARPGRPSPRQPSGIGPDDAGSASRRPSRALGGRAQPAGPRRSADARRDRR